ncbi:hypothetical protein ACWEMN_53615, partial [Streptomyces mirabilis]
NKTPHGRWGGGARQRAAATRQALDITGIRRARYPGLAEIHLDHTTSASALNLIRVVAWWNGHPLDRANHSHLARLQLSLAA